MPRNGPPWPPGSFDLAWEAFSRGEYGPKISYFVVISDSEGPFTSTEKLQEAAGPPAISEIKRVNKGTWTSEQEDIEHAEENVAVCEIEPDQWNRITETSSRKQLIVWINGKKRFAYIVGPPGSRSEEE